MRNRLDDAKSDLIARSAGVAERGRRRADDEALLKRYYRHVAPEDLVDRDPVDVYGAAASHRRMAAERPQGTAAVRVYTPTVDEHGWSSGHTVVEIVTDDMPFLVDSVTMALGRMERNIHLVVHPQLVVCRDVSGRLLDILDMDDSDPGVNERSDAMVESWIHIEIDREPNPDELQRIDTELRSVLRDVREAVEDWPRMRQRAEEIADELAKNELPVPEESAAEAEELLRWLVDNHFTFLGYREYAAERRDGTPVLQPVTGTGLGILRGDEELSSARLPADASDAQLLVLTKANSKATVHRDAYLDYVGVRSFDASGEVTGERRFLGLFTSAVYYESVLRIPVLRRKARQVLELSGLAPTSHSGKDLLQVLETYPRDELFQTPVDDLASIAMAVVHLQERRQLRMFVRADEYGRFLSFLVYLPRDRYNTEVRERIQRLLLDATGGRTVDFTVSIGESRLAQVHFVVRMPP
ncbi:MAG: NAD-glutamate dehydrogenase, partial [bacterium]